MGDKKKQLENDFMTTFKFHVMLGDDMAIQVAGVHKSYGRGARKTEVLRNFNMTIPKGHIYGLLGKLDTLTESNIGFKVAQNPSTKMLHRLLV